MRYKQIILTIPLPLFEALRELRTDAEKFQLVQHAATTDDYYCELIAAGGDILSQKVLHAKAPSIITPNYKHSVIG